MPGSKPGERRGGRQKGARNKAKIEAEAAMAEAAKRATEELGPDHIAAMSPIDVMIYAMQFHAKSSNWTAAAVVAEKVAPYLHAKVATATQPGGDGDQRTIKVTGGLPSAD